MNIFDRLNKDFDELIGPDEMLPFIDDPDSVCTGCMEDLPKEGICPNCDVSKELNYGRLRRY